MERITRLMPSRADFRRMAPPILRGTALGSALGILPGGGAMLASLASHSLEKRASRHPEKFGRGATEGVAGPGPANDAGARASYIPVLTLGIPSDPVTAPMVGALIIQGIQPGPAIVSEQPAPFWGVSVSMWIGNLLPLILPLILSLPMVGSGCGS